MGMGLVPPQYIKQETQKAVTRKANDISRKMYSFSHSTMQRNLHQAKANFEQAPTTENRDQLLLIIGGILHYAEMRKFIAPNVPMENFVRSLKAMAKKALTELKDSSQT